ncbi:hypothetical protein B0T25DRAFT_535698 [Lasiosphaeria hispida]|uniref:Prokineticin domain-containing protein n=1 Tax=Lasiosphaeria hispida TaxID=260671 RepID=A0AAJ0HSM5_9PEZI|nr:hypothetical protein B0T25DRAFT_535698 [Lasiosphaeria hispida]
MHLAAIHSAINTTSLSSITSSVCITGAVDRGTDCSSCVTLPSSTRVGRISSPPSGAKTAGWSCHAILRVVPVTAKRKLRHIPLLPVAFCLAASRPLSASFNSSLFLFTWAFPIFFLSFFRFFVSSSRFYCSLFSCLFPKSSFTITCSFTSLCILSAISSLFNAFAREFWQSSSPAMLILALLILAILLSTLLSLSEELVDSLEGGGSAWGTAAFGSVAGAGLTGLRRA